MGRPNPTESDSDIATVSVAELMASYQPRIYAYIRTLIGDEHAAKDVLQETNVTLLKKTNDFQSGSNFGAWAFRVAYFEVLSYRRTKGRERLQFDQDTLEKLALASEAQNDLLEERVDRLRSCLRRLPRRQRELISRRFLQEESVTAISEDVNMTANAVSQSLFRAKTNLLACMRAEKKR